MLITITSSHPFPEHDAAKARILTSTTGSTYLQSYNTIVAGIEYDWLFVNGLYSRTTIKHIGWFAKMIGFDYYTLKKLYQDDMVMNIETGEVKPREEIF